VSVQVDRLSRLKLDIDTRLVDLWGDLNLLGLDEQTVTTVAAYMRAAYSKGYCDALSEPKRGLLHKEHGYEVPRRRK